MNAKGVVWRLLVCLLLAACGSGGALKDSAWVLTDLNGQPPLPGRQPTLEFTREGAGGSSGCNSFFGDFTARGDRLAFGNLAMTEMACEGVMEQEAAFFQALTRVERYSLVGERLEMLDGAGAIILRWEKPAPQPQVALEGAEWALESFIDGEVASSVLADTRITLRFAGGRVSGSAGCNAYEGEASLKDGALSYGLLAIQVALCPEPAGVMEQETRYMEVLPQATAYELDANQLTLRAPDGRALVFFAQTP